MKTTQELLRHASPGITMGIYAKPVTADKGQEDAIHALFAVTPIRVRRKCGFCIGSGTRCSLVFPDLFLSGLLWKANCKKGNGRPYWTIFELFAIEAAISSQERTPGGSCRRTKAPHRGASSASRTESRRFSLAVVAFPKRE